jgi:O-antigen ligase
MFGVLAEYRIELILAVVVTVVSIPLLARSILGKTSQSLALVGLAFAIFLSMAVGAHWPGGGVNAILQFIPSAFAYLIVCLHCTTKRKVQWVIAMLVFVCMFVIAQGALEMHNGLPTSASNASMESSYFFGMMNAQNEWFYRLRGKGQIDDPNDFAQLIVCTLPLIFFFWKKSRAIRNVFVVLLPVGVLLWGAYLTHSRGSILALLAVVIVALRKRIGTIPALILAGVLFAGATAVGYSGGRNISASAGEDRTALWGEGLELLKSHPLFGVGWGNMPNYAGQTAHNTIVVCAAELGGVGLFFWSMFLLPSLRDVLVVASPKLAAPKEELEIAAVTDASYPIAPAAPQIPDEADIRRLGRLLVLSFTGYLVAGWFLSRAYVMTLFLLGGLTEVAFNMASQRGMSVARLPLGRVIRYSAMLTVAFVLMMYVVLRVINVVH